MAHLFFLTVYEHNEKIRLGANSDGGYVFGDNIGGYDCYISAGVSSEESFSRDFIKKYAMTKSQCYAFDGTIGDYPYDYTTDITFVKKNIGSEQTDGTTNLKEYNENYKDIFLKMDIEGGEYPWLESLSETDLLHYKQIVIEFHGINDDSWNSYYQTKLGCLKKLASTHYLIHPHGNNYAGAQHVLGVVVPNVIELTYIRKDVLNAPKVNTTLLPIENIDFPNASYAQEIGLNHPPFRF